MKSVLFRLSSLAENPAIHPLLFAAFPILFFYAHNVEEAYAKEALMPLALSCVAALAVVVLFRFILYSWVKAGLGTTLFILVFFSYGRLYDSWERWGVIVPKQGILLPGILLLFGYSIYFLKIIRKEFKVTTKLLNIVSVSLILMNSFTIVRFETGAQGAKSPLDARDNIPDVNHSQMDTLSFPSISYS